MVAAPQLGVMTFLGIGTRMTYSKDVYVSDVVAGALRFDEGSGAAAATQTFVTFGEPVVLRDLAVHTGLTDTTMFQLTRDGIPTGDVLRYLPHLDTINNRPALNIPFAAGQRVSGIQRA